MELGQREIPDLSRRTDAGIMSGRERKTKPTLATDGGVVADTPQGSSRQEQHAPGCDDPECEGIDASVERPVLSFECWEQWAAYDKEQLIEDTQ